MAGQPSSKMRVAQFKLPEYDRTIEHFLRSADDEEQIASARTASELARAYMPQLPAVFRLENIFVQPWLQGFAAPVFSSYWKYLDIDVARRR